MKLARLTATIWVFYLSGCCRIAEQLPSELLGESIASEIKISEWIDYSTLGDEIFIYRLEHSKLSANDWRNVGFSEGSKIDGDAMLRDLSIQTKVVTQMGINWSLFRSRKKHYDLYLFLPEQADMSWLLVIGY